MNAFGVVHKGYGLGAYYSREVITPLKRVVSTKASGRIKLLPKRAKVEVKHKKPQQLGF
jgi:hypothetical protein